MLSGRLFHRQDEIDEIIKLLSLELKSRIHIAPFNDVVTCMGILSDGNVIVGDKQGGLSVLDPILLSSIWHSQAHHGEVSQILLLSPLSTEFFTCGKDCRVLHWDNLVLNREFELKSPISSIYWDSTFLWVADCTNIVTSLEFTSEGFENPKEFTFSNKDPILHQFCIYQGKKTLLFATENSLSFQNIQEGNEIFHSRTGKITALCFVQNIESIVYAEEDLLINVVKCSDGRTQSLKYSKGIWYVLQVFELKVLISGGLSSFKEGACLKFWDMDEWTSIVIIQLTHTPLYMAHSEFCSFFYLFSSGQRITRVQKSEENLRKMIQVEDQVQDFYVNDPYIIVAYGCNLKIFNKDQCEKTIEMTGKINFLTAKNDKVSWESDGKIWFMDLSDLNSHYEIITPKFQLGFLNLGKNNDFLIYVEQTHQSSKIVVFDLESTSEVVSILIESKKASEVISIQGYIIYATGDGINFFNIEKDENVFLGTFAKTNLKLLTNNSDTLLFCAGDNEILDIISLNWSLNKDEILKKTLSSSFSTESSKKNSSSLKILFKSILSIALDSNEQYLLVAKENSVQYWNINDELLVWRFKFPIKKNLKTRVSGKNIFLSQSDQILVFSDPTQNDEYLSKPGMVNRFLGVTHNIHEKFYLLGPNSSSLYFLGAIHGIANKWIRTRYDKRVYQWVAFPDCINLLHIFVHLQNQALISKAFEDKCAFIRTNSGKTPLTLALELKNKEIIELVLSNILNISQSHPKILNSIESDLSLVNLFSTPSLSKIYNAAFPIVSQKGLKSYGNLIDKKGVIITNHSYLIDENNFLQAKGYDTLEEISVVYRSSAFRMNFRPGSLESLKFLDSLANCSDHEVFRTQLVKAIILYKWRQIRFYVVIYDLFYLISSLYNLYYVAFTVPFSWLGTILIFAINTVFLIHEILQVFIGKKSYLKSIWNFIDIIRIVLCYVFLYLKFEYFESNLEPFKNLSEKRIYQSVVIVLVLVILLRGLFFFQLFDRTRSMIKVFTDVIKDSLAFLIVLATTTLAFTFLFMILDQDLSFFDAFTSTYGINFGSFNVDLYSSSGNSSKFSYVLLVCFHLATLINPLLMVNLLVSIMNDTFGRLKDNLEMEDLKALAEVITEHESVLLWKKSEHIKEFIQICSQESNDESNTENRIRKIVQLSERVRNMKDSMIEMDNSIKDAFDLYGKKIAESRKQETEFLEKIFKEEANFKMFVTRSNSLN